MGENRGTPFEGSYRKIILYRGHIRGITDLGKYPGRCDRRHQTDSTDTCEETHNLNPKP